MKEEQDRLEAKIKLGEATKIYEERVIDEILRLTELMVKRVYSFTEFADKIRKIIRSQELSELK